MKLTLRQCRMRLLPVLVGLLCLGAVLPLAQAQAPIPVPTSPSTQAPASGLPPCAGWDGVAQLYPSPAMAQDNTLFATGALPQGQDFTYALLKSSDRGASWSQMAPAAPPSISYDLAISPRYAQDQTLYLPLADALARSQDGGLTWTTLAGPAGGGSRVLALAGGDTVFLAVSGGAPGPGAGQGLFYSGDGGQTWQPRYAGGVDGVAVSPDYGQDQTVLIAVGGYHTNGGILKSTDGGQTWQASARGLPAEADPGTRQIAFSPGYAHDHTLFCLSAGGLYKSVDAGERWFQLAARPELAPGGTVDRYILSPRYAADQTLWLDGYQEGRLLSTDGGRTWRALPPAVAPLAAGSYCPPAGRCRPQLFGRARNSESQADQVYQSFDLGASWQCLETPYLPPQPVLWVPLVAS